jgi:AcrR family transcriptional regulator
MNKPATDAKARAARKQARFDEIIEAAARRFAEKGFDATINEIASDLGMSGAALYYYVKNKDQLVYEIWHRAGARLQVGLEDELSSSKPTLVKLRSAFRRHLNTIITNRAIFEVLILQRSTMPKTGAEEFVKAERLYSNTLSELISNIPKDELRVDDPRILARASIAMLNGTIRWYSTNYRLSLDEVADLYFDVITGGIMRQDWVSTDHPGEILRA